MKDSIISLRRTVKPAEMNGKGIDNGTIQYLLQLADLAPTHGRTEPWRFIVYGAVAVALFDKEHADIYRSNTPPENFKEPVYEKLLHTGAGASHVIIAYMKRGTNPNIPEIEEVAATAAAIENLLLGATENGIATFWSSGGRTHHPALRAHFGLGDEDRILGIIYLGYSDAEPKPGKRSVPLAEKVRWIQEQAAGNAG